MPYIHPLTILLKFNSYFKSPGIILLLILQASYSFANPLEEYESYNIVKKLFSKPESEINLLVTQLTIEKIIDPSINISAVTKTINQLATQIDSLLTEDMSPVDVISLINTILYSNGSWNNFKPYQYDFDDPMGTKISNKLISNYIYTRKGNCVSMPFLYLILADKLGLDATISVVPLHYFVKIKGNIVGGYYNVEATYNGQISLDSSYITNFHIKPISIKNAIYLQPLSKREIVAVMAITLSEHYAKQEQWEQSMAIASLALKHYPNYVYAMAKLSNGYYRLLDIMISETKDGSTSNEKRHMNHLSYANIYWLGKATQLGLQMPSAQQNAEYLEEIEANKPHPSTQSRGK